VCSERKFQEKPTIYYASGPKISGFGTFVIKSSPERYGRNPLNMKPYKINARKKLNFRPSSKIKEKLN
jgi:nucleoid DNA-binding protein